MGAKYSEWSRLLHLVLLSAYITSWPSTLQTRVEWVIVGQSATSACFGITYKLTSVSQSHANIITKFVESSKLVETYMEYAYDYKYYTSVENLV